MSGTEKAIKALQDYWDAVNAMTEEEFNVLGNIMCGIGISNHAIDMVKRRLKKATEIKPCPFCGGNAETDRIANCYLIRCLEYKASGRVCSCRQSAINEWNRRAT